MKLDINYFSGIYQLQSKQLIDASMDEVWDFFSSPINLNKITPDDMNFEITSSILEHTYPGQIITYQIEIVKFIKTSWVTEITYCKDKEYFVDEQRFGPYVMWHHEHHFEEQADGRVLMTDIVSYKLPLGWIGRLFAGRIIKNKVRGIFSHRFTIIDDYFKK